MIQNWDNQLGQAEFVSSSKLRVIYIGGVEHNGSTFLGAALGNHPQIVCVGELTSLARQGWLGQECCACGETITDCPFWSQVRDQWTETTGRDLQSLVDLENAFDRHRRFFALLKNKHSPSDRFKDYADQTQNLFLAIQQVSGKDVIADTSKRFSRALALSMISNVDLRLIHLVRDARGVAYSWSKPTRPRQRSWLDSSIRWNVTNTAFEMIGKSLGTNHFMRLRYEDLIRDPASSLNQIGKFAGLDLSTLADRIIHGEQLNTDHIGVGNGFLRQTKQVKLSQSIDWPQRVSVREQRKIWTITWPLMRHYGYSP